MTIFNNRLALRAADAILHDRPVAVSFFVTNRCNFRCDFCSYPEFNNDRSKELSPEEMGEVASRLAGVGVTMAAVIGGEPLVRKDIVEILRAMTSHLVVQVTTNGWFMTPELAEAIFAAGVYMVNVSLDSSNEEVHNAGRGNAGSFKRAIAAAQMLRDAKKVAKDQRVGFETVLSGRNCGDLEAMVRLAGEMGIHIVFQPYSSGHTEDGIDEMVSVATDVTEQLLRLKEETGAVYNSKTMIREMESFFQAGTKDGCMAGLSIFNVDAYGNITRCEEQRKRYGRILDLSRSELLAALSRIRADTDEDGCNTCYLRTRGESEPLYTEDLAEFLRACREMFGVSPPAILKELARLPGMKEVTKGALSAARRLAGR